MANVFHLIVVGDESVDKHLMGVSTLGATGALLFEITTETEEGKIDALIKQLDEMGVYSWKREVSEKYGDIYWAARQEIQTHTAEQEDIALGVNLSTGMKIAVAAVEDALMSPPWEDEHLKIHGDVKKPDAFRYEVLERDGKISLRTAPLHTLSGTPFPETSDKYVIHPGSRIIERLRNFYITLPVSWLFFKRSIRRRTRRLLRRLRLRS